MRLLLHINLKEWNGNSYTIKKITRGYYMFFNNWIRKVRKPSSDSTATKLFAEEMNTIVPKATLELVTIKLLYLATKNPYNGISTDKDYLYAMKRLLKQCEFSDIQFTLTDDNLIFNDMKSLIEEIKANV